jgi:general secretion pathway protein G
MKKQSTKKRNRGGFTLLEVLLVLIILGVIAALVVPQLTGSQQKAMILAAETTIKKLEAKVEFYAVEHESTYPETLDDLLEPVDTDGNVMKPYEKTFPKDPWKQPMNYKLELSTDGSDSMEPRIWSNGPNKKDDDGNGDDINNWAEFEEDN